jgi:hypothetical protein
VLSNKNSRDISRDFDLFSDVPGIFVYFTFLAEPLTIICGTLVGKHRLRP